MPPSDMDAVVDALRAAERVVVTSHDNPDGDALGSLLATHLALASLGKDSVMVLGGEQPLPGEYGFLRLEEHGLLRTAPADVAERVLVAVDCAQESRIVDPTLWTGPAATAYRVELHEHLLAVRPAVGAARTAADQLEVASAAGGG